MASSTRVTFEVIHSEKNITLLFSKSYKNFLVGKRSEQCKNNKKICENIIHTETKFKTAKLIKHLAHVPPAYELSIITF